MANSAQGVALLVFLLAFTFLGMAFFSGGGMLYLLLFVVCAVVSIPLFQKARRMERLEE